MTRQMFLHEIATSEISDKQTLSTIKILNWNIRNPSIDRAKIQADWILQNDCDVIILTEAKNSDGCTYISNWLQSYKYKVFRSSATDNDYCVLLAVRNINASFWECGVQFLPHRAIGVKCNISQDIVGILGLYVPSRGPIEKRNVSKRAFQDQIISLLPSLSETQDINHLVVGGDLNVIEKSHIPAYPFFGEWEYDFYNAFEKNNLKDAYRLLHPDEQEYSWLGRDGDGYRFDHFFVSSKLSPTIVSCSYVHDGRKNNLSDHSAMLLEINAQMIASRSVL